MPDSNAMIVRPAEAGDWETVVDFNCRLAEESENKILDRDTVAAGVRALLDDARKGRYFLACDASDAIVGQLMHTWEWSDWRNGEIWWLQSVYVIPAFRRRGVFRTLFDHLHQLAAADPGVIGLRLYVENNNERAQQTYINMGLDVAGYHVMQRLFD